MKVYANCTWGFAKDVGLFIYKDGKQVPISCDLSSEQARALAKDLLTAADRADELERICDEHDKE